MLAQIANLQARVARAEVATIVTAKAANAAANAANAATKKLQETYSLIVTGQSEQYKSWLTYTNS